MGEAKRRKAEIDELKASGKKLPRFSRVEFRREMTLAALTGVAKVLGKWGIK